ncbi:MAG: GNAT family N-acetyltransferase [Prevotellaceae bacterium]|nr:GNAT family N-acetyltransferase [Prevotellaceae bacterium]
MSLKKELIYIDGKDRTDDIVSYSYRDNVCVIIFKNNNTPYPYKESKVKIVKSAINSDKSDNIFRYLEKLLYEAIFQPEGAEPLPRDIIKKPEIDNYIRDFGKKRGDFCLFAELNGKTVGGAWLRILDGEPKGYGNIDSETPELAMAVFREYRHLGIGTGLLYNTLI